ncbi:MAG: hypothetical protein EOO27_12370 [Comamonadaceae bacterium]|nr:MAG: hypothetical protein EOO27_12370 [Comamonadaceae bacterium]
MSEITPEVTPAATEVAPESVAPTGVPAPAETTAAETAAEAKSVAELPEWAQRELKAVREEAAANRTKGNEKAKAAAEEAAKAAREEQLRTVGKALGLPGFEDEKVDPQKLVESLTAERDQAAAEKASAAKALRDYQVRDAVREAAQGKANLDALYDSKTFLSSVKNIDPSAPDFAAQVTAAIDGAITTNPLLKAVAPAATQTSGGEHTGDTGTGEDAPATGIDAFRKSRRERRG